MWAALSDPSDAFFALLGACGRLTPERHLLAPSPRPPIGFGRWEALAADGVGGQRRERSAHFFLPPPSCFTLRYHSSCQADRPL